MNKQSRPKSFRLAWWRLLIVHAVLFGIVLVATLLSADERVLRMASPLSFGQLAVLAIWLTFGEGKTAVRLAIYIVLGVVVSAIGMNAVRYGLETVVVASTQIIFMMLAISFPLSISRLRGWRLVDVSDSNRDDKPWEISTRLLFAMTLLIGLLLTLHRLVTSMGFPEDDGRLGFPNHPYSALALVVVIGVTFLGMSLAIMSAVWSCLAAGRWLSRLLATSIVVALVVAFPMHIRGGSLAHMQWAGMIVTTMLTVVLSLLLLRRCGVRVARSGSPTTKRLADLDRIRDELLERDGSCRDVNFVGMTWADALTILRRLIERADTGTAVDANGGALQLDASIVHEASRTTSHVHLCLESSSVPFTHFQCFIFADTDVPFMELTFFPDDIVHSDAPLREVVHFLDSLCAGTSITDYFVRYENASWTFGDNGPTSGVIFTRSTVGVS